MERNAKLALVNEEEWKKQMDALRLETLRKPLPGNPSTNNSF